MYYEKLVDYNNQKKQKKTYLVMYYTMFCRLSSPCQLVISTLLLGLFLSSPIVAEISAGETFSSTLISAPGDERHQRRETWDLFGFLMMGK